jgi:hypothetical protein
MARLKFTPEVFDRLHPDPRKDAQNKKYGAFEREVFDTANNFSVITFEGRGTKKRVDLAGDLMTAIVKCNASFRSCIYASNAAGRHIVLDRKDYEYWIKRWRLTQRSCISD